MAKSNEQIVKQIVDHADKEGSGYSNWYAGIASDPKERLFEEHKVPQKNYYWIHVEANSADDARKIEKTLLGKGFDGGAGGGDDESKHVYAYKKSSITAE